MPRVTLLDHLNTPFYLCTFSEKLLEKWLEEMMTFLSSQVKPEYRDTVGPIRMSVHPMFDIHGTPDSCADSRIICQMYDMPWDPKHSMRAYRGIKEGRRIQASRLKIQDRERENARKDRP